MVDRRIHRPGTVFVLLRLGSNILRATLGLELLQVQPNVVIIIIINISFS